MVCCLKGICQGIKKVKAWNVTVWNIMVQDHQAFVTASNLSSKLVLINRKNSNTECQELGLG